MEDNSSEVNWVPQSVVTVAGTPKRATQPEMKASMHLAASIFFSEMASTHRVDLSMTTSRYMCPTSEDGRGPTQFMCRCKNLHASTGMAWRGAAGCLWTLPHWQCWQSWHTTQRTAGEGLAATWPGSLDRVSAIMLSAPSMCLISGMYLATQESCLVCLAVHGSDTLNKVLLRVYGPCRQQNRGCLTGDGSAGCQRALSIESGIFLLSSLQLYVQETEGLPAALAWLPLLQARPHVRW